MYIISTEYLVLIAGTIGVATLGRWSNLRWLPGVLGVLFLTWYYPAALIFFILAFIVSLSIIKKSVLPTAHVLILLSVLLVIFVTQKWLPRDVQLSGTAIGLSTIGIAYMVPKLIHLLVEVYKEKLFVTDWRVLFTYVFYPFSFPTGPIHAYPVFEQDYHRKTVVWDEISMGLERILIGTFKVVVLGNFLISSKFTGWITGADLDPAVFDYLDCFRYGANLYFQFSGFTDIAIGVSAIAGYRMPENFNFPFLAHNINDFWKRWHMSLSDWTKNYVFFPIFAQTRNAYLAIIVTMLAIGLWHELTPRYVAWAFYHGLGIAVWQWLQNVLGDQPKETWWKKGIGMGLTFNFVILSFAITKESDLTESLNIYKRILTYIIEHVFFFI